MEPSTITLGASAVALPIVANILRYIRRVLFREQPSSKSWRGQRLEALRNAGYEVEDLFFAEECLASAATPAAAVARSLPGLPAAVKAK